MNRRNRRAGIGRQSPAADWQQSVAVGTHSPNTMGQWRSPTETR